MIKRITAILLLAVLTVSCLFGCASSKMKIENFEWELVRVIALRGNDVVVIASNDESDIEAEKIKITLTAKDGIITMHDSLNGTEYRGTYKRTQATPRGSDYELQIEGNSGYGTVAMTVYADGSERPTMPVSLGGYTLQFYA